MLEERLSALGGRPIQAEVPVSQVDGPAPLSFVQDRIRLIHLTEPDVPVYHTLRVFRLRGALDRQVLSASLKEILRRHEVLRTTFEEVDGEPRQIVHEPFKAPLRFVDLSGFPERVREAERIRIAQEEVRRPTDLERGPLLRMLLIRLAEREHDLVLVAHHAIFDGWSTDVFRRELAVLYEAFSAGQPSPLPGLPIQYGDYARRQREWLRSETVERQLDYWRRRLDGVQPLDLRTDYARPSRPRHRGAELYFEVPAGLTASLQELSRRERVTLFTLLLAAFQVLLHRHSRQDDLTVGCPVAGRRHADTEGLIGCFINVLVLRADLSGNPAFRSFLRQVHVTVLEALSNQDVPFEKLVAELHPERQPNRLPLYQVVFQLRNYPKSIETEAGLQVEIEQVDSGLARYELSLEFTERDGRLYGVCAYDRDLFSSETIDLLQQQYVGLLEQIVSAPDTAIDVYSLRTDRDKSILPDLSLSLPQPVHEPVFKTVDQLARDFPERTAIEEGDRHYGYANLYRRSLQIAFELRRRGLQPGETVALSGPLGFDLVAGILGVWRCGGVVMTIDPVFPGERKALMLREGRARYAVLTGEADVSPEWCAELSPSRILRLGDVVRELDDRLEDLPNVRPEDAAFIFFTSGTAGTPKAVLGEHRGISHFLDWQRQTFDAGPGDRCAGLTGISFDVVLRTIFLPLTSGGTLCLPQEALLPEEVMAWIVSRGITLIHAVPSLARSWLDARRTIERGTARLRWTYFAGEPLTGKLLEAWRDAFGTHGMVNLYGPTETTMAKVFYIVPEDPEPGLLPVGVPLPQIQAIVVGSGGQPCGILEPGEVTIRTPFRTRGYLNAPEQTKERFVPNPWSDERDDVLYRTGDVGYYRPDGLLVVEGRLDDQVKVNGVRVEPGEVVAVLSRHPSVRACTVVARQKETGQHQLVAYVVAEEDVTTASLQHHLARYLPAALIPSAFVFLEALPLTPNGKVDRKALPAPEPAQNKEAYVAPYTPLERELASLWKEMLHLNRVGVRDNFFELGGHSLLAVRMAARLRSRLNTEIPVHLLLSAPTIAELSAAITKRMAESSGVQKLNHILIEVENGSLPAP